MKNNNNIKHNLKSLLDAQLTHKTVIVRVDFNVPMRNGIIQDDTRIKAALNTILYLSDKKAKVILMSHLGKVKTEEDVASKSLKPVAVRLSALLRREIFFCPAIEGKELETAIDKLQGGEILLMENTRFADVIDPSGVINLNVKRESNCDLSLSKYWALLGDVFVNDAFATCHRRHASNVGIAREIAVVCFGLLVEKELAMLDHVVHNFQRPYVAILGGAKIKDKIKVLDHLFVHADQVIIGGGMSYTFLKAQGYEIGTSLFEEGSLAYAVRSLTKYADKIVLPLDYAVASKFENDDRAIHYVDYNNMPSNMMGMDIGQKTIDLFASVLAQAQTVFWNGPLGVFEFENYATGTKAILQALKDFKNVPHSHLFSVIGGGDTAAAAEQMHFTAGDFSFISTGGGAALHYIAQEPLPAVDIILNHK